MVRQEGVPECDAVVSVEVLPDQERVDIETESRTFFAGGFATHNCAATKRDQAKIVFGEAQRMVKASPDLKRRITSFVGNLHVMAHNQKLEPLGADADSMDGLNIHGRSSTSFTRTRRGPWWTCSRRPRAPGLNR